MNKKIFYANLIYYLSLLGVAVVFILGYAKVLKNDIVSSILIQILVISSVPVLLFSALNHKKPKDTLKSFGIKKVSSSIVWISILLGLILYLVNSYIANLFYNILAILGFDPSVNYLSIGYGNLIKDFILTAILPGFCEELLHRGLLLNTYKNEGRTRTGLVISSLLFGLMHLNIGQFFYATILGFLMGIVAISAESIIPSMIIHFMNNALNVYMSYGAEQNWPFTRLIRFVESGFGNNIFASIIFITAFVSLLLWAYVLLVKKILKIKAKEKADIIYKELNIANLTPEQAQTKINEINQILSSNFKLENKENKKPTFKEMLFVYCSMFLGFIVTISTFIWGIL